MTDDPETRPGCGRRPITDDDLAELAARAVVLVAPTDPPALPLMVVYGPDPDPAGVIPYAVALPIEDARQLHLNVPALFRFVEVMQPRVWQALEAEDDGHAEGVNR